MIPHNSVIQEEESSPISPKYKEEDDIVMLYP